MAALSFELLVDGPAFRDRLLEDLADADQRAWISCLSFEGDGAGRPIADALVGLDDVDRRVLADALFTSAMINDRFLYRPDNLFDDELWAERRATRAMLEELAHAGVSVRRAHPPGPLFSRFLQRGHKKTFVVDDVVYVGGMNLSEHNFRWHDLMIRITAPALVDALVEDFEATWAGRGMTGTREIGPHRLTSFDGHSNPRVFAPILERIRSTRSSIELVSPYLSPPFTEPLREARAGGAEVALLTPEANNWPLFRTATLDEARRHDYRIHLYPDRMNHMKALLVDDETLVVGSTNFDLFSYWVHEELVLELEDPDLVEAFRSQVLDPDIAASHSPDAFPNPVRGAAARAGLRAVFRTVQALAPLSRRGPSVVPLDG